MFSNIVGLCAAVVCVLGAPSTDVVPLERRPPTVIPILEQSEEIEANGTFKFSYETGNGIKREEISYDKVLPKTRSGVSSDENDEDYNNEIHVQQGSYSYTAPDGNIITVRYIADENGFRAIGDHLPKPPSILVAASASRISGRRSKTVYSDAGGSVPISTITSVPIPIVVQAVDSKVSVPSSASAPVLSATKTVLTETQKSTTSEASTTTEVTSTVETSASTTESASTSTEVLTSEVTSTEQPTTAAVSTNVVSSEPSTVEAAATNTSASSIDVATVAATSASA